MSLVNFMSNDTWQNMRELWEAKPSVTYMDVANMVGCSRQAVFKRARREGWTRPKDAVDLARRAMTLADYAAEKSARDTRLKPSADKPEPDKPEPDEPPDDEPEPPPVINKPPVATKANKPVVVKPLDVEVEPIQAGTAVMMRANVITRHRKEWDGARNIVYKAIREADNDAARRGKMVADTLAVIQAGERKAWQLDEPERAGDTPGELHIVIERT